MGAFLIFILIVEHYIADIQEVGNIALPVIFLNGEGQIKGFCSEIVCKLAKTEANAFHISACGRLRNVEFEMRAFFAH